ncbi:MAG: (2Fe-2S)-binding protein [Anaerolineaceae bacterium]|nr:MAG: (2Fe-2S)-binding protein [Anaerolineaceae bacterium]
MRVTFEVNGRQVAVNSPPNRTLLDVLREDFGLTGAKDACGGEGECGACTVIMDGKSVNSCMVFIGQVHGCAIETIEGIAKDGELHPLQRAFVEAGAVQCGYCTPGAIMAAKGLLQENSRPSDEQIREGLSGNLCRCTGYVKMIEAVRRAAEELSHA